MRCSFNKILKWVLLMIIAAILFYFLRGYVKDDKSSVYPNNTLLLSLKQDANQLSPETQTDDVFLSIKTSSKYHGDRLGIVLATWWNYAPNNIMIFSDEDDNDLNKKLGAHFVNTKCPNDHTRKSLCCKMAVEFDTYMATDKRWFCHVDDDNYVNVPALVKLLRTYDHTQPWYIGKPSLAYPIKMSIGPYDQPQEVTFWFATGGAGLCISRALAVKMKPFAGGGKLTDTCDSIRLPDDCTLGYIVSYLLGYNLTVVNQFRSHLEHLASIQEKDVHDQITLSYALVWHGSPSGTNMVNVPGLPVDRDPTRMFSVHCILVPETPYCQMSAGVDANNNALR